MSRNFKTLSDKVLSDPKRRERVDQARQEALAEHVEECLTRHIASARGCPLAPCTSDPSCRSLARDALTDLRPLLSPVTPVTDATEGDDGYTGYTDTRVAGVTPSSEES